MDILVRQFDRGSGLGGKEILRRCNIIQTHTKTAAGTQYQLLRGHGRIRVLVTDTKRCRQLSCTKRTIMHSHHLVVPLHQKLILVSVGECDRLTTTVEAAALPSQTPDNVLPTQIVSTISQY